MRGATSQNADDGFLVIVSERILNAFLVLFFIEILIGLPDEFHSSV